jgi:hypothetical protein
MIFKQVKELAISNVYLVSSYQPDMKMLISIFVLLLSDDVLLDYESLLLRDVRELGVCFLWCQWALRVSEKELL